MYSLYMTSSEGCGYQDDASSHIAGKLAITTMMKSADQQRNSKTKHVAEKTTWNMWLSFVSFADYRIS